LLGLFSLVLRLAALFLLQPAPPSLSTACAPLLRAMSSVVDVLLFFDQ